MSFRGYISLPKSAKFCDWWQRVTDTPATPFNEVVASTAIQKFVNELQAMEAGIKVQNKSADNSEALRQALQRLCANLQIHCEQATERRTHCAQQGISSRCTPPQRQEQNS